ncbi:uncharacterized protein LOC141719426 [Apium graveolens]|uniref:uncharacterized protein LOC141719426 n=1 Tax=Apium graveolens TaxID=4045 RepID=UPI003D792F6A
MGYMDKSWISADRDSLEYEIGVEKFLIFAEENCKDPKMIPCPCARCCNFKKFSVKIIRGRLYEKGFSLGYIDWIWHGAKASCRSSDGSTMPPPCSENIEQNIEENFAASQVGDICEAAYNNRGNLGDDCDKHSEEFKRFLADAEQPLFECSDSSKLDSMLKLHNWKARFGISDSAFTDLLSSIGALLPKDNVLPSNAYTAKKTLSDLGLEYIKIHACPNEGILYRGVNSDFVQCPKCHISRWKLGKGGKWRLNVPAKIMWYFPIIPRFKRICKSNSTAELLTWHANQRSQDGQMRHPADSPSWRNVDYKWPEFDNEPRNLRLAMAADGINPHNNGMNNGYSCWPVVLTTYNLPPWLCMKRKFLMLTILVSGPQEPGNNIDVFLQPLIDDLKKLWKEGEPDVHDAHTKSSFTLRAILMWTINDFPAYGNLSGCVNKGYMCCPVCGDDTVAKYLPYTKKMCFQGHRRYLPRNHPYRRKKTAFNGEQELGNARQILSGEEVLRQQEWIKFAFRNAVKKSKKVDCPWKKKSVFFELEYWKFHYVRHCLDIMHVEKNVCDNLIGTLLNMKFKTKDSEASRLDMVEMGIRTDLAPQKVGARRTYLPPAAYTLSKEKKRKLLKSLSSMQLPYGHSSNIKNYVSMPDMKWMYPFERFNKVLKSYVRNRLYPEGCIAESYLGEESVEFYSEFVRLSCTTAGLPKDKAKLDGPLSPAIIKSVEEKERDEAHLHDAQGIIRRNLSREKKTVQWLIGEHNRLLSSWFKKKVSEMIRNGKDVPEMIRSLAGKPSFSVLTYEGFLIDGVRYFTKERDNMRVVQNSGMSLVTKTVQVSSAKDLNLVESDMTFYGVIEEIWELDYRAFKAPLFLCRWADSDKGVKVDDLGFTLVDLSRQGHRNDKYISVDQVKQVFYVNDPVDITWLVVFTSTNRDYHEVYNDDDLGDTTLKNPPFCSQIPKVNVLVDVDDDADEPSLGNQREDVEGIWIRK